MTDLSQMSGLEQLAALSQGGKSLAPIAAHFNMVGISYSEGDVVLEATPDASHYNPIGTVHGGFAATLLDSACGTAVHTSLRPGESYTSLEIKVNFLRTITEQTGPVRVHGWVTKAGSHAAFAEAELHDAAGKLLATASSTCAVFQSRG